MAILRAQCSFGADTAFPRDRLTITPHFKVTELPAAGHDNQGLANDLCTALSTWLGNNREVTVKMYDAQHAKPNPPLAIKVKQPGLCPTSNNNREVALCLSFYADTNVPRRRGRLYIPAIFIAGSTMPVRPTAAHRDSVSEFVGIFASLGGLDVDWVVWSRADHAAHTVTNWWCDDEWDTQRRRGLRPTTRTVGTTSG
jgi:hypothetical protein